MGVFKFVRYLPAFPGRHEDHTLSAMRGVLNPGKPNGQTDRKAVSFL